jgi:hypothetical protein
MRSIPSENAELFCKNRWEQSPDFDYGRVDFISQSKTFSIKNFFYQELNEEIIRGSYAPNFAHQSYKEKRKSFGSRS